jgi:hypothetical protein
MDKDTIWIMDVLDCDVGVGPIHLLQLKIARYLVYFETQ